MCNKRFGKPVLHTCFLYYLPPLFCNVNTSNLVHLLGVSSAASQQFLTEVAKPNRIGLLTSSSYQTSLIWFGSPALAVLLTILCISQADAQYRSRLIHKMHQVPRYCGTAVLRYGFVAAQVLLCTPLWTVDSALLLKSTHVVILYMRQFEPAHSSDRNLDRKP